MSDLIKIGAYMKRKIKALKYMPREHLIAWLQWHDLRQSLAYVERDGKILAAGVARPIADPLNRIDKYVFDEGADYIYADQAASESAEHFASIILDMCKRYPYAKTFMYRNRKTGKHRSYDIDKFLKSTLNQGSSYVWRR